MSETAKIKVNDLPENAEKPNEEVELPVVDNDKKGGHGEGGCCGACGG
ncbi:MULTISPECIES: hypothetical protein [Neisseria]|uniref:CCGSCS motif protein n=1 Tax=Neisseria lactamica (strain 020-06) TaxID=489653 RepID=E4ZDM9_NEIL0|nr:MULTISPECIES: hypothetical protein [Neisseria]KFJ35643.1 putative identified by MetaGeneAnnotator [Neisseria lactamica ATCC 23970]CBN87463.1 hypothetical protein NLA_12420 [Neisseria lactamica 020-06]CBX21675.1 unnamed protein product [Neisseria lactamica Y92-1009]VTQ48246.1 Uncharacterised protein [Neisseria lactamica]